MCPLCGDPTDAVINSSRRQKRRVLTTRWCRLQRTFLETETIGILSDATGSWKFKIAGCRCLTGSSCNSVCRPLLESDAMSTAISCLWGSRKELSRVIPDNFHVTEVENAKIAAETLQFRSMVHCVNLETNIVTDGLTNDLCAAKYCNPSWIILIRQVNVLVVNKHETLAGSLNLLSLSPVS